MAQIGRWLAAYSTVATLRDFRLIKDVHPSIHGVARAAAAAPRRWTGPVLRMWASNGPQFAQIPTTRPTRTVARTPEDNLMCRSGTQCFDWADAIRGRKHPPLLHPIGPNPAGAIRRPIALRRRTNPLKPPLRHRTHVQRPPRAWRNTEHSPLHPTRSTSPSIADPPQTDLATPTHCDF